MMLSDENMEFRAHSYDCEEETDMPETITKHTPGPWHTWTTGKLESIFVDSASHGSVCKVARKDGCEANARLIAAAPDLLEACKDALTALDDVYDVDEPEPGHQKESPFSGVGFLMDTLRTAIAKAEAPNV